MYGKLEEKTLPRRLEQHFYPSDFYARCVACFVAFSALLVLSPLLLICALIIRISSPGKIFFRQQRVGRGGEIFILYKFRTMVASTEGLPITAANDCRITLFGRILRKSKFDELPELYNVLLGDMSFIGPRPEVVELVDLDNPMWHEILRVRPGISDPVTLQFRNEENLLAGVEDKKKFYLEVIQPYKLNGYTEYLKSKNLKNDLKVVAQTFKVVLFPQTAPPLKIEEISSSKRSDVNVSLAVRHSVRQIKK